MIPLVCFVFCVNQGFAEANSAEDLKSALQHFEEFYLNKLKANSYVGSSFMLIHNNDLIWKVSYGFADRENHIKMDENQILIDKSQSTYSQHIKKLEKSGFIRGWKNGKYIYYSLNKPKLMEFVYLWENWIKNLSS